MSAGTPLRQHPMPSSLARKLRQEAEAASLERAAREVQTTDPKTASRKFYEARTIRRAYA